MSPTQNGLQLIRRALLAGVLSDEAFDELLPKAARMRSQQYWTPLSVARRAAALFQEHGARRVLDVGCGPGKFCLAAAASQRTVEFVGAEQRAHLVEVANQLAARLSLVNVSFACEDAFERAWNSFDGFYFFNPFWENMAPDNGKFDQSVELSVERFLQEQKRSTLALRGLRAGAIVISYHGIGTPIPSSYELVRSEPAGTDHLRVWRRKRRVDQDWYYVETEDGVCRVSDRMIKATEERWKNCAG